MNFSKIFKSVLFATVLTLTSSFLGIGKASALNFTPNNDQVYTFQLANGQRLNLPSSQQIKGGGIYSYPADTTGDQFFRLRSGSGPWNLQKNNTNFSISTSSLTPTNLTLTQAYTSGFGRYQDF